MKTDGKVISIVILGVGACLLSSLAGHWFFTKNQSNQRLLCQIRQLPEKVETLRLLSRDFIQSGDAEAWREMIHNIETLQLNVTDASRTDMKWSNKLQDLNENIAEYHRFLNRIHDPAIRLNEVKSKVQRIGLSFSTEVQDRIIIPYRKDEGLRMYRGQRIDPIKTRIKETAYDLMGLHIQQQLILTELLLDWDLAGYGEKKEVIAEAMEKHKTQLHYLNVLMGNEPDIDRIIGSLEKKLSELAQYEQQIVKYFSELDLTNRDLVAEGGILLRNCAEFSTEIMSEISQADTLKRRLNLALPVAILCGLTFLGALLAKDIIRFVEDLQESESRLSEAQKLAGMGYWEWNVDTGEVDWSEEVYKIFQLNGQRGPGRRGSFSERGSIPVGKWR